MAYKARRNYVALTVTIPQNTISRLIDLINTALGANTECPGACRELNIQSAAGNASSIFVGSTDVSAVNNGYELVSGAAGAVGASRLYRATVSAVSLSELYLFSAGVNQKLSVEVMPL